MSLLTYSKEFSFECVGSGYLSSWMLFDLVSSDFKWNQSNDLLIDWDSFEYSQFTIHELKQLLKKDIFFYLRARITEESVITYKWKQILTGGRSTLTIIY